MYACYYVENTVFLGYARNVIHFCADLTKEIQVEHGLENRLKHLHRADISIHV